MATTLVPAAATRADIVQAVTDALGAQRTVLEFSSFGAREFLAQGFWVTKALIAFLRNPERQKHRKMLPRKYKYQTSLETFSHPCIRARVARRWRSLEARRPRRRSRRSRTSRTRACRRRSSPCTSRKPSAWPGVRWRNGPMGREDKWRPDVLTARLPSSGSVGVESSKYCASGVQMLCVI